MGGRVVADGYGVALGGPDPHRPPHWSKSPRSLCVGVLSPSVPHWLLDN